MNTPGAPKSSNIRNEITIGKNNFEEYNCPFEERKYENFVYLTCEDVI